MHRFEFHGPALTEKQKGPRASDPSDWKNDLVSEAMYRRFLTTLADQFLASPRDYGVARFG
ncbi:hypothetical protein [Bradyrhizobium uaiense]|uniref:Uncharacterized protein n=1 Tax=Bradyrhizobium uaiense TaxID=2594946 RepID=A0A6P1BJ31_9BRAD|nr:hypothetical protein [Bradyrhizobium uaiense]NEU97631.1 hypothetical protein [Bradyrhizobium uaiense]